MGSWCTEAQVEQFISKQELASLCDDDRDGSAAKITAIVLTLRVRATNRLWGKVKTRVDIREIAALNPATCTEGATGYPGLEGCAAQLTASFARFRHDAEGKTVPPDHPSLVEADEIARGEADPC